ncbi:MAG: transcriptional repressor [Candidatus Omnitrophica bacterium]|nr:transcriptional repressor [Candidatus Omnitrophota bacterium]
MDVLDKVDRHLNAEQIYKRASEIYPTLGLATVYRNLELLVRIGLVWKFDVGDDKTRYEIAQWSRETHHHHLICKKCNSVIDYSESIDNERDFLREREKNLSRKYNFKIENHCIDFFGLCSKCKNTD